MTVEKMAIVKKNIGYWKNWNNSRSEASLDYLKKEMIKFKAYIDKLNEKNWKYNLISLYYQASFTSSEVLDVNEQSHLHYLKVLDLMDKIKKANADNTESLYQQYAVAIFDMCSHYEDVYQKMMEDMNIVRLRAYRPGYFGAFNGPVLSEFYKNCRILSQHFDYLFCCK